MAVRLKEGVLKTWLRLTFEGLQQRRGVAGPRGTSVNLLISFNPALVS